MTPDSFSDGGRFLSPADAIARARQMIAQGADWIDVGAESTRPGALPVPADEQIRRIEPLLREIVDGGGEVVWSIDTTSAIVAEFALSCGVSVINDISAGRHDPAMLPLAARTGAPIILMHMLGTPQTMQADPRYDDVVEDVAVFLRGRIESAVAAGVDPRRLLIDPGIGFGKTVRHNLELLNRLAELCRIGPPVVVGTSRKRFIGHVTGVSEPADRVFGTAATVAWSIANGAAAVRVHDVVEMVQVARMTVAMMNPRIV